MTLQRAGEFYTWNAPPIIPVIKDRILPLGSLMFIWGEQETFKSWMVLDLAFSVASGQDWLLFETNKYPVLLINTELPEALYHERFQQVADTKGVLPSNLYVISDTDIKFTTDRGFSELQTWCQQIVSTEGSPPGLIILDNLYRTLSGEITGTTANQFLDVVAAIRTRFDSAFCVVHHSRKTTYDIAHKEVIRRGIEDMTGSKYLGNNAATIFENRKTEVQGVDHAIYMVPEKMWFTRTPPPLMRFKVDDKARFHLC